MNKEQSEKYGNIKNLENAISVCILETALKTNGIASLNAGITDTLSKNLLGRDSLKKGIKLTWEDKGLNIDVYIIVRYGVKIPETAWNLQRRIKEELLNVTDISVLNINVHVQGVDFLNGEDKA